jgi:hypothetical protein
VRHVYDDSGEPSGLLLLCPADTASTTLGSCSCFSAAPCVPQVRYWWSTPPRPTGPPPTPCPRNAPALPPSRPPMPHPGIRAEFFSPPFRIASDPQDRLPSPTRSTAPRHPSHIGFSQTCAVPLDTPTPCFPNHKWGAKEPLEGKRGALAPFRLVKRGCAPWPPFTAIGPSMIHLLSFQECSHDHR